MKVYHIDGSSLGLYGFCEVKNKKIVDTHIEVDQPLTNNQAEWLALFTCLLHAPVNSRIQIFSDSQLVVNQFNGRYKVKDEDLKRIASWCRIVMKTRNLEVELKWIPRKENLFGKILEREVHRRRAERWKK